MAPTMLQQAQNDSRVLQNDKMLFLIPQAQLLTNLQ